MFYAGVEHSLNDGDFLSYWIQGNSEYGIL